jgi:hypothetical protein
MLNTTKAIAVFAMMSTASVAGANDPATAAQTPENAHKFLTVALIGSKLADTYSSFDSVSSTACQTRMFFVWGGKTVNYRIGWDGITDIQNTGAIVTFTGTFYNSDGRILTPAKLDFSSTTSAARAFKAMEVLRKNCDVTAATGF